MNAVANKVHSMMTERGWIAYKFEQECGLASPTIRRWFQTDTYPSIPALMQVCQSFGITMAEFFAEGNLVELTSDKKEMHDDFAKLKKADQDSVRSIIKSLIPKA